jgi:hypothetical protein
VPEKTEKIWSERRSYALDILCKMPWLRGLIYICSIIPVVVQLIAPPGPSNFLTQLEDSGNLYEYSAA